MVGQAYLMSDRPADAAVSFGRSAEAAPTWRRSGEAILLQGTALLSSGDAERAKATWSKLLEANESSKMADQARYKLAQLASYS